MLPHPPPPKKITWPPLLAHTGSSVVVADSSGHCRVHVTWESQCQGGHGARSEEMYCVELKGDRQCALLFFLGCHKFSMTSARHNWQFGQGWARSSAL